MAKIEKVQIRMIAESNETFVLLFKPSEENFLKAVSVTQRLALRSVLNRSQPRFTVCDYVTMLHSISATHLHWKLLND